MPSTALPSASNGYAAPLGMVLSKSAWDAALTDVASRLVALEAVSATLSTVVSEVTASALGYVETNVGSALASVAAQIVTIQGEITTAQGPVGSLQSGTVPAVNVSFSGGGLTSTTVQAAIVELAGDVGTDVATLTASLAAAGAVARLRSNIMRI